jgi:hypothetical protein
MKFVLLCEGKTEKLALPEFLKRWLDTKLPKRVGIKPIKYEGWRELHDDYTKKARMYLDDPDIIGVFALLDLYGPTFYPAHLQSVQEKISWGRKHLEDAIHHDKFRFYFAVHELDAWLFSDPSLFPPEVTRALPGKIQHPETIDFDEPPARLLDKLYSQKLKKSYKKSVNGRDLFSRLSPDKAYEKCPNLQEMLDDMLRMAESAGL